MVEFDTQDSDDPVCPHCGYTYKDASTIGLYNGDAQVVECDRCKEPYLATASVLTTYCTRPWTRVDEAKASLNRSQSLERSARIMAMQAALISGCDIDSYWKRLLHQNGTTCNLELELKLELELALELELELELVPKQLQQEAPSGSKDG